MIEDIYREREIDPELGLVIGTITESKEIINHALERKLLIACKQGVRKGWDSC